MRNGGEGNAGSRAEMGFVWLARGGRMWKKNCRSSGSRQRLRGVVREWVGGFNSEGDGKKGGLWFTCCATCKQINPTGSRSTEPASSRMSLCAALEDRFPNGNPLPPIRLSISMGTCVNHTTPHHTRDGDI